MSKLFFHISEWLNLDGTEAQIPLTAEQSQKIFQYHLLELNPVRDEMGMPVHVRSGLRPVWWEKIKGRDPSDPSSDREDWSQHCFIDLGATDASIEKHSEEPHKPKQLWLKFFRLLKQTSYKRIAYYPDLRFFHCDYDASERKYYISTQGWEQTSFDRLADIVGTNQNGN